MLTDRESEGEKTAKKSGRARLALPMSQRHAGPRAAPAAERRAVRVHDASVTVTFVLPAGVGKHFCSWAPDNTLQGRKTVPSCPVSSFNNMKSSHVPSDHTKLSTRGRTRTHQRCGRLPCRSNPHPTPLSTTRRETTCFPSHVFNFMKRAS